MDYTVKMQSKIVKMSMSKAGGNASANSYKYMQVIPPSWAKELGITQDDRGVKMSFDGKQIIIERLD